MNKVIIEILENEINDRFDKHPEEDKATICKAINGNNKLVLSIGKNVSLLEYSFFDISKCTKVDEIVELLNQHPYQTQEEIDERNRENHYDNKEEQSKI